MRSGGCHRMGAKQVLRVPKAIPLRLVGIDVSTTGTGIAPDHRGTPSFRIVTDDSEGGGFERHTQVSQGLRLRGEFERPLYVAHELGYAVALVGGTVTAIAAADGRSWWQRAR